MELNEKEKAGKDLNKDNNALMYAEFAGIALFSNSFFTMREESENELDFKLKITGAENEQELNDWEYACNRYGRWLAYEQAYLVKKK